MSQHLSSVGKAYERGFAIKDKSDTESEWCTNVSRCSDRHCSMVRSLRGPALRATDSCMSTWAPSCLGKIYQTF